MTVLFQTRQPTVRCNRCGHKTPITLKTRAYGRGKKEHYFTCHTCRTKYTSYCTDEQVRAWQKKARTETDSDQLLLLQTKMKERMDKLKEELPQ